MTERKDDRLWGGRFDREPNADFDAFQRSFSFDRRLLPYELAVDRAWARALEKIGILTEVEVRFTAQGEGVTRVDFEHRHLERLGDGEGAMQLLAGMTTGWGLILDRYAAAVGG